MLLYLLVTFLPQAVTSTPTTRPPTTTLPNPRFEAPAEFADKVETFLSWMKWGGAVAGTAGLMYCGILMAAGQRNRHSLSADGAAGIPWALAGVSLTASAVSIVAIFMDL